MRTFTVIPALSDHLLPSAWRTALRNPESKSRRLTKQVCATPLRLFFFEFQRGGVDAIAEASGPRAVVKDVPEVRVADAAFDFRALHTEARVAGELDVLFRDGRPEARPPGP